MALPGENSRIGLPGRIPLPGLLESPIETTYLAHDLRMKMSLRNESFDHTFVDLRPRVTYANSKKQVAAQRSKSPRLSTIVGTQPLVCGVDRRPPGCRLGAA